MSVIMTTVLFAAAALTIHQAGTSSLQESETPSAKMSGTLIVLNKAEASCSLLDLATGAAVATLETGDGPHEVAVSPDGRTAVVCNYGSRAPGNTLTVIDLTGPSVVKTIDMVEYHRPHGIEFLRDGERVVVTCEQEQKVVIVNLEQGEVERAIDTDARISHMLALSADEKRAFVANIGSGSMTVVDLESGEHVQNVETGAGAEGIAVSPDGNEVWVGNRGADTISVIDPKSLELLATIECPSFPIRVKFTPDGSKALVSNARSGDLAIFDTTKRESVKRIPMELTPVERTDERLFGDQFGQSPVPVGILVLPTGTHAFVANTNADIVTVIDLELLEVTGRLTAGKEPDGLGYTPLAVTNSD